MSTVPIDNSSPPSPHLLGKSRKRKKTPPTHEDVVDSPVSAMTSIFSTTLSSSSTKTNSSVALEDSMLAENDNFYEDLKVLPTELRPSAILTTGQCFHWKAVVVPDSADLRNNGGSNKDKMSAWGTHNATDFVGVLRVSIDESIVVRIRETPNTTLFRVLYNPPSPSTRSQSNVEINVTRVLRDYFQLDQVMSLQDLYQQWSAADPERLARIAPCIPGVRIVQQDPWECLISFICSSNNNIPRITKMLNAIRQTYGQPLVTMDEDESNDNSINTTNPTTYYSFPSLATMLQHATEAELRNACGLGYRAKYVMNTMKRLEELGGESYLHDLRRMSQHPAAADDDGNDGASHRLRLLVQEKLLVFPGVGRKVADCVALFSLNQTNVIPVDVHVWNMARRDYDKDDRNNYSNNTSSTGGVLRHVKSLTPSVYEHVGNLFRSRFGGMAGWAHSLLFVAELPSFRAVLPHDLVQDMDKFRELERAKKKMRASPSEHVNK